MSISIRIYWVKNVNRDLFDKHTFIKGLKSAACMAAGILASALAATLLLCAVYALPTDRIDKNVQQSARTIREEGTYPKLSQWFTSQLDNYTDSIMLLEAAYDSNTSILNQSMSAYRGRMEGKHPAKTLIAHYVQGEAFDSVASYSRYWHGYLLFLKPLLQVMDYHSVRILNGVVQTLVTAMICFLLVRRSMSVYVIPFLITYGMLMPVALAKALQYSSCFYAFSAGVLALLLIKKEALDLRAKWVFFCVGIGTAFFDLLTYPIAAYGIPAVFCLALTESESLKKRIGNLIRNGIFWVVGYGGMWFAKWVFASVVTGENVIAVGTDALMNRTSNIGADGIEQINLLSCEGINYAKFFTTPVTGLLIIFVLYFAVQCIRKRRELTLGSTGKKALPYIVAGLAPVVWFAVAANHSQTHAWFTNKACAVSVLALCFALISVIHKPSPWNDGAHN